MGSVPRFRQGRLLIASPSLTDPNFHRSVILLLEHSESGALGVVLNRPTSILTRDALPARLCEPLVDDDVVYEGGPCEPGSVLLLGQFGEGAESVGGSPIVGDLRVVEPDADLRPVAHAISGLRAFGGYAGWAAGQLDDEIAEEAWIDAECDLDDVFCAEPDHLWSRVLERKGGNYRLVARMPLDPSLN